MCYGTQHEACYGTQLEAGHSAAAATLYSLIKRLKPIAREGKSMSEAAQAMSVVYSGAVSRVHLTGTQRRLL